MAKKSFDNMNINPEPVVAKLTKSTKTREERRAEKAALKASTNTKQEASSEAKPPQGKTSRAIRPKKATEERKVAASFTLDPDVAESLFRCAYWRRKPRSAIVNQAIRLLLADAPAADLKPVPRDV